MKSYPEYRDSKIEWIGKIPKHWQVFRNFAIFSDRSDRGYPHLLPFSVTQQSGVIPQEYSSDQIVRSSSKTEDGKRICRGDLVYNKMRMWQGAVGVAPAEGRVSTAYVVCQPIRDLIPEFFEYLYRTPLYMTQSLRFSYGGCKDQYCLYPKDFKNIYTIFPPKWEQTQIANFLDRKTEQIDELIRIKERRIELLEEQRTALINQAVTQGLDPNVEMKPSGVEWIGEIPEHWESKRLGYVSTIFKGGTPKRNVDRYFQGDLPWARPVDITALQGALYIHDTEIHISEEALGNSGARRLPPGTVLLTSRATIGETAITTVPMATNQGFANFVCNDQLLNIFLAYYLRAIKDLLISLGSGSTFLEVTKGTLVGVKIPLPPLSEQKQIVDFLEQKNKQIDDLIATEQRKIELLKEYRQSLISEAVTGKIDVRNEV